ncbi:MAG TPA: helix-turn-helix domain-containing protein [Bacillota bacterium]|nr:helix-turn-helix domain-containing protein [Bacillota bacterium]
MAEFRCNLKKYRQLANLTQEELAQMVNGCRETIQQFEAGKYNLSSRPAIDISRVVKAPIEDISILDRGSRAWHLPSRLA